MRREKIIVVGFAGSGPGKSAAGSGMAESSPLRARMRLAQRRAIAVMPAYIRSMARRRACQASEVRASAIGKERHSLGSSPQRRKACRAMTQRKRLSQPVCQAVSQTMPSGLGDLLLSLGRKQRTAMARTPSAMCSLRQAATSQMSQSGVRCLAFMSGSIAAVRGGGGNRPQIHQLFSCPRLEIAGEDSCGGRFNSAGFERFFAPAGEHALVVRRTRASLAAHHEGYQGSAPVGEPSW